MIFNHISGRPMSMCPLECPRRSYAGGRGEVGILLLFDENSASEPPLRALKVHPCWRPTLSGFLQARLACTLAQSWGEQRYLGNEMEKTLPKEKSESVTPTRNNRLEGRLLRLPEVIDRVGLKRSAIYKWMLEDRFPRSRSLSPRCAVWVEAEIEEWISQIKDRP